MCKNTYPSCARRVYHPQSYKNQMTHMLLMCSHIEKIDWFLLYGDKVIFREIENLANKKLKGNFQGQG